MEDNLRQGLILTSLRISRKANERIKDSIQLLDKESSFIQKFVKLPRNLQQKVSIHWQPFRPDMDGRQGLKVKINPSDAAQMTTKKSKEDMRDIVKAATIDYLNDNPQELIEAILRDYFTSTKPYYKNEAEGQTTVK